MVQADATLLSSVVAGRGAVSLGAIAIWALLASYPLALVAPGFVGVVFLVGQVIPAITEAVPEYEQIGFAVIGAVSALALALGYRREFLFGLTFFGVVAALDLTIRRARARWT